MPTVTLDTSALPFGDHLKLLEHRGFDVAVVTVTDRGQTHPHMRPELRHLTTIPETAVWNETPWGVGLYGGTDDPRLERILQIIINGSFPKDRSNLPPGQLNQFRDALILYAHVREGRDIFVTDDERAFVKADRRLLLETEFGTRIMTKREFLKEFLGA